jgi:hypothetical protein
MAVSVETAPSAAGPSPDDGPVPDGVDAGPDTAAGPPEPVDAGRTEGLAPPVADGGAPGEGDPPLDDPEAEEAAAVVDEPTLTGSEAAKAANAALRSLARAARSFLIYDANNEAIRQFLSDYQEACKAALMHGALDLEVRPFELVRDGEIVYVQRDRDRSLAFRLFRDGVRRLTLSPDVPWLELLRLLEILSVRYTGIRQYEDDIVTLLWKAGFTGIEIVAVEGFVLDGDEEQGAEGAAAAAARRSGPRVEVPSDWDRPGPEHDAGDPSRLMWVPLGDAAVGPLREEISSRAVGSLAVTLCDEMLDLVDDPTDPTGLSDVSALLDEVRSLLLAEGQVAALLALAESVSDLATVNDDERAIELARFTSATALRRIIHSAARTHAEVPPELEALLDLVPGDHLTVLVNLLGVERAAGSRELARHLIERYVRTRGDYVGDLIDRSSDEIAADLLHAVSDAALERAVGLVPRVLARSGHSLQGEVRRVLELAPADVLPAAVLMSWLSSPEADTRSAVVARLGSLGGVGVYDGLLKHLDGLNGKAREEASAIGLALAALDADRAMEQLGDWVRPRSFWDRLRGVAGGGLQQWAGVAGLGSLEGEYPNDAIRWLSARADADLEAHCRRTLAGRRRRGGTQHSDVQAQGKALQHRGVLAHPGRIVLTGNMLCFEPTRALDRMAGARELDLPVRSIRSIEQRGLDRIVHVQIGEDVYRFSGKGALEVFRALAPQLAAAGEE